MALGMDCFKLNLEDCRLTCTTHNSSGRIQSPYSAHFLGVWCCCQPSAESRFEDSCHRHLHSSQGVSRVTSRSSSRCWARGQLGHFVSSPTQPFTTKTDSFPFSYFSFDGPTYLFICYAHVGCRLNADQTICRNTKLFTSSYVTHNKKYNKVNPTHERK